MSDRLTDEQLREITEPKYGQYGKFETAMASELLSLRAEREELWGTQKICFDKVVRERDALRTHNAQLEAALREIAEQKTDAELGDDGPWGSNFDFVEGYDQSIAKARAALAQPAESWATFQARVNEWMHACFGAEISADTMERNHRFLEESLELVQSLGCTSSEAHQLVDYVFGREVGVPTQEVGGVMVTLAALCNAAGLDVESAGEVELARVWTKIEKIRAKQAAKPKHSPLPEATEPATDGAQAVKLEPGWLKRDIDRCAARVAPPATAGAQAASRETRPINVIDQLEVDIIEAGLEAWKDNGRSKLSNMTAAWRRMTSLALTAAEQRVREQASKSDTEWASRLWAKLDLDDETVPQAEARLSAALSQARAEGIADGLERAAKIAESWVGLSAAKALAAAIRRAKP